MIMNMALGGFRAKYAVTYPSGSTCKVHCDAESITLTAPNTSGSYTFSLPVRGTWYASCTDGTQTVNSVTHIVFNGESYSDTLEYPVPTPTFTATVKVTYPTGLTCRLSDGSVHDLSSHFSFLFPARSGGRPERMVRDGREDVCLLHRACAGYYSPLCRY